jgi:CheY-like chemotaxis protein
MARVRRLPGRLGSIPAIAITAYTEPQDRRRALSAGFTDVMAKPFDLLALVDALWQMRPAARDVPSQARR